MYSNDAYKNVAGSIAAPETDRHYDVGFIPHIPRDDADGGAVRDAADAGDAGYVVDGFDASGDGGGQGGGNGGGGGGLLRGNTTVYAVPFEDGTSVV
jgi:hypothetical protein